MFKGVIQYSGRDGYVWTQELAGNNTQQRAQDAAIKWSIAVGRWHTVHSVTVVDENTNQIVWTKSTA